MLGGWQNVAADSVAARHFAVHATLHLWTRENALAGLKAIAGVARRALRERPWTLEAGFYCHDLCVTGARFMRDPDGATRRGVVTVDALVEELAP